nr:response regulator transcription factor [Pseudarthrobacter psychrotolerans]
MQTMLVGMTEPITVLVVDDDPGIRSSLQSLLEAAGYLLETAADGRAALERVAATSPDLLVVDVLMPIMDGLALCRMLRSAGNTVPVLLLTARSDVADCVAGLDAGADDYLSKPFEPDELLARLRAMARRTARLPPGPNGYRDLVLVPDAHAVRQKGRWIDLSSTEYAILCVLAENPEQALSRGQISDAVWGYAMAPASNALEVYVSYLRRKLEADGEPRLIQTVRGVGYRLAAS